MVAAIVLLVLIVDQIIKIMVKTNMSIAQSIDVFPWFKIAFVENNGMAFGMQLFGKLFLSIFRIIAIGAFVWYICKIKNKGFPTGYIVTLAFILGGAMGNLLDSMFYGLIFSESGYSAAEVASFVPFGQGYAPFLYGKVVDMFYFPLIRFDWPDTFPVRGEMMNWLGFDFRWPSWMPCSDEPFMFFKPVFNFADACISVGVVSLILFFNKELVKLEKIFNKK